MDGILNINKPQGETSFSIVAKVKRLIGERRVGHAGTLDPMATGVLPVCLGQGTRVVEFLADANKSYRAQIELGVTTDTYDATGRITAKKDSSGISQRQFETALNSFRGAIQQTPPMYSAIKYHGKPLYHLARAGLRVELQSRLIQVYRLELLDWRPPLASIEIECGKGTYVRSLAHDLGLTLGCGANLISLIRLRCGQFDIKDSITMSQLEGEFRHGYWHRFVYPIDIVLSHWMAVVVNDDTAMAIRNGRPVHLDNDTLPSSKARCRVYASDGRFLGIVQFNSEKGHWQPTKVLMKSV
jgi:tRNA pseudouridine55 synthase